jgi:hypothetical protein
VVRVGIICTSSLFFFFIFFCLCLQCPLQVYIQVYIYIYLYILIPTCIFYLFVSLLLPSKHKHMCTENSKENKGYLPISPTFSILLAFFQNQSKMCKCACEKIAKKRGVSIYLPTYLYFGASQRQASIKRC